MNQDDPTAVLQGVSIPPQPTLLKNIHAELQKSAPNLRKISEQISADVAISAAVLKTVNSAFFGLKSEVVSIHHAMSLLGVDTTVNIVSGFALRQSFDTGKISLPRFWDAATNTARLCAFLATRLGGMDPDPAYTLGLFRDCGIPLMAQRFPGYLQTLASANASEDGLFTDTEDEAYNTNHATVGYYVSREWCLPDTIRQIILRHHDLETMIALDAPSGEEIPTLTAVLKMADWGDNEFRGGQPDLEWQRYGPLVLDYLHLSESDSLDLLEDMKDLLLTSH